MIRRRAAAAATAAAATTAALGLAACGSSGSAVTAPRIGAARVFQLAGFTPSAPVTPGHPTTISFTVQQPDGQPLTQYRAGAGPHTGVHLIIVRNDLAYIIHEHPPVGPNGLLRQQVTFPAPGSYRVLVDLYPNLPGQTAPNFQLFRTIDVAGAYHPRALPSFHADQVIDGYHVEMLAHPALKAVQAQFVTVNVLDPQGRKVDFVPWFGALAHAIFFHQGSLDYFHTHVCGAGATNCATFGATRIAGVSTTPGKLTIGVLLPVPGTWELFLQLKAGGRVITAPYTLRVT